MLLSIICSWQAVLPLINDGGVGAESCRTLSTFSICFIEFSQANFGRKMTPHPWLKSICEPSLKNETGASWHSEVKGSKLLIIFLIDNTFLALAVWTVLYLIQLGLAETYWRRKAIVATNILQKKKEKKTELESCFWKKFSECGQLGKLHSPSVTDHLTPSTFLSPAILHLYPSYYEPPEVKLLLSLFEKKAGDAVASKHLAA